MNFLRMAAVIWFACGLLGVLVIGFRRPRRIFRGGIDTVPVVLAGVLLGVISLYSAITNRDDDF